MRESIRDVPEESFARNQLMHRKAIEVQQMDENQKDEVTTHEICGNLHGKKHSYQYLIYYIHFFYGGP